MEGKFAPLSGGFMIVSIIGLLFSVLYLIKNSPSWGFAFAIVFGAMFVASLISMVKGPIPKM